MKALKSMLIFFRRGILFWNRLLKALLQKANGTASTQVWPSSLKCLEWRGGPAVVWKPGRLHNESEAGLPPNWMVTLPPRCGTSYAMLLTSCCVSPLNKPKQVNPIDTLKPFLFLLHGTTSAPLIPGSPSSVTMPSHEWGESERLH